MTTFYEAVKVEQRKAIELSRAYGIEVGSELSFESLVWIRRKKDFKVSGYIPVLLMEH